MAHADVVWLTAEEVRRRFFPDRVLFGCSSAPPRLDLRSSTEREACVLGNQFASLLVTSRVRGRERVYRGMDIVQAFGIPGVCPTCLSKYEPHQRGHAYCSEKCRLLANRELERSGIMLSVGVPPIVAAVSGALLAKVRRIAVRNGLTVSESLRAALLVGCEALGA